MKNTNDLKKKNYLIYFLSFLLSIFCVFLVFLKIDIYPFGEKTLITGDMYRQYIDFFNYLKRALEGMVSFSYSFEKSLGGSLVGLFGYYLSSPLNLLIVFFKENQIPLFITIIAMLKIGLSSLTFSIFVKNRFSDVTNTLVILFSLMYGLMTYNISNMSNIMWLDGVYMLPLVLLGVYKYINENTKRFLIFSILFTIIFNWYTAFMVCLFLPFYYVYEILIRDKTWKNYRDYVVSFSKFCLIEAFSVLLSMFYFFPIILDLLQGKGATSDLIFSFATNCTFIEQFQAFTYGNTYILVFCGSLPIVFVISLFLSRATFWEKIISLFFILLGFTMYYSETLNCVWSGLRIPQGWPCRYGFLISAIILIIALYYINYYHECEYNVSEGSKKIVTKSLIILIFALVFMEYFFSVPSIRIIVQIVFIISAISLISNDFRISGNIKNISLVTIVFIEMLLNGYFVARDDYTYLYDEYTSYMEEQDAISKNLHGKTEKTFYRVEQTLRKDYRTNSLMNENMSVGFYGTTHYSSSNDSLNYDFLSTMGYFNREGGGAQAVIRYNEPLLPSDSFLGIKYILSGKDFYGLDKQLEMDKHNGKYVFENPYALSLGNMLPKMSMNSIEETNPFEAQNQLFSHLLGKKVSLFKPLDFVKEIEETGIKYTINKLNYNFPIYGYGRYSTSDLKLKINGNEITNYQSWLSYLVYNVGTTKDNNYVEMLNTNENNLNDEVYFYYLDMNEFQTAISVLQKTQVDPIKVNKNIVEWEVYTDKADKFLTTTIPFSNSWEIEVNGKKVNAEKMFDTFIQIPLQEGENVIKMEYKIPGITTGFVISLSTLTIYEIFKRIKSHLRLF